MAKLAVASGGHFGDAVEIFAAGLMVYPIGPPWTSTIAANCSPRGFDSGNSVSRRIIRVAGRNFRSTSGPLAGAAVD